MLWQLGLDPQYAGAESINPASLAAMSLPGTIVLRPNEFTQPNFDMVYKTMMGGS